MQVDVLRPACGRHRRVQFRLRVPDLVDFDSHTVACDQPRGLEFRADFRVQFVQDYDRVSFFVEFDRVHEPHGGFGVGRRVQMTAEAREGARAFWWERGEPARG
jgi:hypothetical protein